MKRILTVCVLALLAIGSRAYAYPQFQLSRDPTCTACHLSPDGAGLLSENGLATAEAIAWKSTNSAFLNGAVTPPAWLQLGGDLRLAGGFVDNGKAGGAFYPMQAEVQANAGAHGFSAYVTGGFRRPQDDGSAMHVLWSREHYVMWQSNPGENSGVYVRAGRFLPTFGLRLAEHVVYTQRYGGRPLYFEAYGASVAYISNAFEVHATGFAHDRWASTAEHGDGGAGYAELRFGPHAAIGAEAKYSKADDENYLYAGMTAKAYFPGPDLLLQGEGQFIRHHITAGAGDRRKQVAAYVLATHMFANNFMLDVGLGHFTEDTRVPGLDRDCLDVNVHWFTTSHLEWLLTTRAELLDHGSGPNGGYALVQVHYRL